MYKFEMVISCLPDGSIQHTLKDAFLKPFDGETREVKRMSDIEHSSEHDMFFIRLRPIDIEGERIVQGIVNLMMLIGWGVTLRDYDHIVDESNIVYLARYEDAVAVEIALINAMRLAGGRFIG